MKVVHYEWYGQPKLRFRLSFFERRKIRKAQKCLDKMLKQCGGVGSMAMFGEKTKRLYGAMNTARSALRQINSCLTNY